MYLMHKNTPVAVVSCIGNKPFGFEQVLNEHLLPVGTKRDLVIGGNAYFRAWLEMRAVPHDRQELTQLLQLIKISLSEAIFQSMAVSITDCYWFANSETDVNSIKWEDISFHTKGFNDTLGLSIITNQSCELTDFRTPDLTTDGTLKKGWMLLNNEPILIKFGNLGANAHGANLLSANEVVATKVARLMDIPCVEYFPVTIASTGEIACGCQSFISDNQHEFVNALQLMHDNPFLGNIELYHELCVMVGQKAIDRMILFDHIIHNTDRHEKNFGIIRDADTQAIISMAPLFDNGSSFGWNHTEDIQSMDDAKPFFRSRKAQLEMVNNIKNVNIPDVKEIQQLLRETYEAFNIDEQMYEIAKQDVGDSYRILHEIIKEQEMAAQGTSITKDDDYER